MRCKLLNVGQPCAILNVITPSLTKVTHDHCYCTSQQEKLYHETTVTGPSETPSLSNHDISSYFDTISVTEQSILDKVCLTHEQRQDLEKRTRNQVDNFEWHEARRYRITGSKCGRILEQHTRTEALLRNCLYPKPMLNPLPKSIAWGRKN